jgi:hypothetical protein
MDVLVLIDKLDDLAHNAKAVPLTDQVRVERREVQDIVAEIRAAIREDLTDAPTQVLTLVDELDELARDAKPVPLTRHVRIDRAEVYDILDRLRAAIPEARGAGSTSSWPT